MCLSTPLGLALSSGCAVRGRMDPLWNSIVVGGIQDGKPFLGTVGMLGVQFSDEHIATGGSPCALQPDSASPCALRRPAPARVDQLVLMRYFP